MEEYPELDLENIEMYTLCTPEALFLIIIPSNTNEAILKVFPRKKDYRDLMLRKQEIPLN